VAGEGLPRWACLTSRSISHCRHWYRRLPRHTVSAASAPPPCVRLLTTRMLRRLPRSRGEAGDLLESLLAAAGPVLRRPSVPSIALICRHGRAPSGSGSVAVLDGLAVAAPDLKVTVDPVENRGFRVPHGDQLYVLCRRSLCPRSARRARPRRPLQRGRSSLRRSRRQASLFTPTRSFKVLPEAISPRRVLAAAWRRSRAGRRPWHSGLGHCRSTRPGERLAGRGMPPRLQPCPRRRGAGGGRMREVEDG